MLRKKVYERQKVVSKSNDAGVETGGRETNWAKSNPRKQALGVLATTGRDERAQGDKGGWESWVVGVINYLAQNPVEEWWIR